jgi:chromosome segregation ATPase
MVVGQMKGDISLMRDEQKIQGEQLDNVDNDLHAVEVATIKPEGADGADLPTRLKALSDGHRANAAAIDKIQRDAAKLLTRDDVAFMRSRIDRLFNTLRHLQSQMAEQKLQIDSTEQTARSALQEAKKASSPTIAGDTPTTGYPADDAVSLAQSGA